MIWYLAVLTTLGILALWVLLVPICELLDKIFQARMSATLWESFRHWKTGKRGKA